MNKKRLLALSLALSMVPITAYCGFDTPETVKESLREDNTVNATVKATITVDENSIRRDVDNKIAGIQFEPSTDESTLLKSGTTNFQPDVEDFLKNELYNVPLMRMGGTSIEKKSSWNNIGPLGSRKPSYDINTGEPGNNATNFGMVEWVKQGLMTNPDVQFIPCISMTHATPEENAMVAQFLLDDKDKSPYGKMRASFGLEDPVNVLCFELGNEIDSGPQGWVFYQPKLDWYLEAAEANIKAISAVCPDAKFMLCGKTAPVSYSEDIHLWTRPMLEKFKDYPNVKYIAFHQYYSGYELAYTYEYREKMYNDMYEILGEDTDWQVIFTEHAAWFDYEGSNRMTELYSVLATGQFFNRMLGYEPPLVGGATYHAYTGSDGWWSMYKRIDNKLYRTGNAYIAGLYADNLGDRVVETTVESDNEDLTSYDSRVQRFTVLATPKGEHTLNLFLVNRSPDTEFDIDFNFKNQYTLVSEEQITAPNINSFVGSAETKDVFRDIKTEKNEKNFSHYKMPTKSAILLTLETTAKLPTKDGAAVSDAGEAEYTGDNLFSDIDYSAAKNEINLLAESGVLNGVGNNMFAPKKILTRAELACLLVQVLGIDISSQLEPVFSDIARDSWYYNAITHAYAEGFVRGGNEGKYRPEDPITLEEMLTIASRIAGAGADWDVQQRDTVLEAALGGSDISEWAKDGVAYAITHGLTDKFMGGLNMKQDVTREMAAVIAYKLYALRR